MKVLRSVCAVWVLMLCSVAPASAMHASWTAMVAASTPTTDCLEANVAEDAAADLAVKARLLSALCKENTGLAVGLAFVAGLLTSLSPCVYPLIPVTITVFGARQATSKLKAFTLSALYVLGMSVLYSALGVAAASMGKGAGSMMANPAVVLVFGTLFLVMAASMFGAFELNVPMGLQQKLATVGGAGYRGSFVMGLAAGVIAAPCTGPVLAVILGLISKSQQPMLGVSLMIAYSLGMGMLFLVVGTFSSSLTKIPKSGRWMETVKAVMGLSMIGVALYLMRPHLTVLSEFAETLAGLPHADGIALGLVLLGCMGGALHLSFKDDGAAAKIRKGLGLALASLGILTLLGSLTSTTAVAATGEQMVWVATHDGALTDGKTQSKPVMIDFGAEWCAACKELEKVTYKDPTVIAEARRFVNVKIDSTEMSDAMTALWQKYGITGLPVVVFVDSKGTVLTDPRVDGFLEPKDFIREMRRVK